MKYILPILLIISCPVLAQLKADFSASITQGCSPLTVNFQDNSTGSPTSWFWDFGNGITSTSQNPTVTYTLYGNYTVRLIVGNSTEEAYKVNDINVYATPKPDFLVPIGDSGCVSLQSVFKDTTSFFNASPKSWLWDFGDGSTSNQQNPIHTFTTESKYDISLTVQTTQGCLATITKTNAVKAGNKPLANLSASPLNGCASVIRDFKNESSGSITASKWDFGDGGISFDRNPKYHYQDTGIFNVKLTVSENGCKDSIQIPNYVHIDGPVAKFLTVFNCSDRFTINFYDRSIGTVSRSWDFGDGQTSIFPNVVHVYSSPGIYIISLIINGSVCSDTARDTVHIKVGAPVLQVSPAKSFYCKYDTIKFTFENYDTADVVYISWRFGDSTLGLSYSNSIIHFYDSSGKFKPVGYIRDLAYCLDTVSINGNIIINGPTADFSADTSSCTNTSVTFNETSTSRGSPINQWLWTYGDGDMQNSRTPLKHKYRFPGTYGVQLKVTDAISCSDSIKQSIEIFSSPLVDAGTDTLACAGSKVSLNATGASGYIWQNNPDLSCTNCANPVATPSQSAIYYVIGTTNGCSASDSVAVKVQTKELINVQPSTYAVCVGASVQLTASGTDLYSWSPAAGLNNTTIANHAASPSASTVYTVAGTDSNACFSDKATVNINVNPLPSVNIPNNIVQLPAGSTYLLQGVASPDVQTWQWLPKAGLSCYDCPSPIATVYNTSTYIVTVYNTNGCSSSDSITLIALCNNDIMFVPNAFTPNNDGMNDYFFPNSKSNVTIESLSIYNRWGQKVFENKNFPVNTYSGGWNGKYKDQDQNPDVYVYVMTFKCLNGNRVTRKGNITLLR